MRVQHHGHWTFYQPANPPLGFPPGALFCRREDGTDWYVFQRQLSRDTVKMTVQSINNDRHIVQAATRDASALFPVNSLLIEVDGIDDPEPQARFGQREFFPDTDTFGEIATPMPVISDRQFFQALAMKGLITPDEALAAVKTGEIPARMQQFLDAITDPEQRFAAQMILSGATQFQREHPLVDEFGHALGLSDKEITELWRTAAQL